MCDFLIHVQLYLIILKKKQQHLMKINKKNVWISISNGPAHVKMSFIAFANIDCSGEPMHLLLHKSQTPPREHGWIALTECSVNIFLLFSHQWHVYLCNWGPYVRLAFVPNMSSSWNKVIIIIIITASPESSIVTAFVIGKAIRASNKTQISGPIEWLRIHVL